MSMKTSPVGSVGFTDEYFARAAGGLAARHRSGDYPVAGPAPQRPAIAKPPCGPCGGPAGAGGRRDGIEWRVPRVNRLPSEDAMPRTTRPPRKPKPPRAAVPPADVLTLAET